MDDTRNKILDCQQAIANAGLFKSNETSAVACVREFYTAYGTDDDSKVQEAINDIYKTNMSLRDVTEIKELTLREMNMDLKEDFDNGKEYTIRDINKKFAYEVTEAANLSKERAASCRNTRRKRAARYENQGKAGGAGRI